MISRTRIHKGFGLSFGRRAAIAAASTLMILCAVPTPQAAALDDVGVRAGPDRPFPTPVSRAQSLDQRSTLTRTGLRRRLGRILRGFGGSAGVWVARFADSQPLFLRNARRGFPIASNTKLFTTGAALELLGPASKLDTEVWSLGEISSEGVLSGGLVIVGGGDPTLGRVGIARLASHIGQAGVTKVDGPVMYDERNFDLRRSIPQTGVTGGPYLGSLSGLSYEWGWGGSGPLANPARSAAARLAWKLRSRGINVTGTVRRVSEDANPVAEIASISSPTMAAIAKATNTPSDNFLAEMLLKVIADRSGGPGSTRAGAALVRNFAKANGARISIENGSGLSRRNRATPGAVGRFITSMASKEAPLAGAFTNSLAIAGRTGTLAYRMRGTAAQGRCRAKTGTLNGVSALSGICSAPGGRIVFSMLFGGNVDIYSAHLAQDRAVAAIARYRAADGNSG